MDIIYFTYFNIDKRDWPTQMICSPLFALFILFLLNPPRYKID